LNKVVNRISFLPVSFLMPISATVLLSSAVLALPSRTVFSDQAQGHNAQALSLKVGKGYGVNIIVPEGETIKKAWLDDISRIGLSFDGNLCQWTTQQQQECKDEGATVIHLRQLEPVNFPSLPRSSDGGTLLTVVTAGAEGRKVYVFKLTPISGMAEFANLNIRPDSEKPTLLLPFTPVEKALPTVRAAAASREGNVPAHTAITPTPPQLLSPASVTASSTVPAPTRVESPSVAASASTGATTPSLQAITDINAIRAGLQVARNKKQINFGTTKWNQAQSALLWLSRGESRESAARKSGLPMPILTQLIRWGQQSP
jgi:hypothetical protein